MNEMNQTARKIPNLFEQKTDCCGCEACVNACPKRAISMVEDECGFRYPHIDESLCIACGRCKKVCAFQNKEETHSPIETYAARSSDRELAKKSSSGGIFAAIAAEVLASGGIVFGAAFDKDWSVHHIPIESIDELNKLQGSKYTQSATGDAYKKAKDALKAGKTVLYSGTPCQIAGLYGYLGGDHEKLITIDLVCHGVPNDRMLREYLHGIEAKVGGEITDFTFRDKELGWGINGSVTLRKNNKVQKKILWRSESSYFAYFLDGWIYRENCYRCKYASAKRPADLTIGDYWGIASAHPEYLKDGWNEQEGISLIIVNSEKGCSAIKAFGQKLDLKPSAYDKAAAGNDNLNHPTAPGKRNEIIETYRNGGWDAVELRFKSKNRKQIYLGKVKHMLPKGVKRFIRRTLRKIKK